MPENATEERKRLLRLYGAEIVDSPGAEGSNGAVRLALELAERDPRYFMPFQYANEANPRAHYEGTGAEIADGARPRRRARRRPRHGRDADGHRRAAARVVPRRRRRRGRAASGRSGDGPALARRRLRAADPRRLEARPEGARLERGVRRRPCARCSTSEGIFAGVSAGAVVHVARKLAAELDEGVVVCVLADGGWKYLSAVLGRGGRRAARWSARSGGDPGRVRAAIAEHAREEAPERSCGLVLLRDGRAERYDPGRNGAASPYRFELEVDPESGSPRTRATSSPSSTRTRDRAAPVAHGRRERRPLGGPAVPDLLARARRARRVDDRRRLGRSARDRLTRFGSGLLGRRLERRRQLLDARPLDLVDAEDHPVVPHLVPDPAAGRAGRRRSRRSCGSPPGAGRCRTAR